MLQTAFHTCAAKEVYPILMSAKIKGNFFAECVRSSQLIHPNVVQFMGIHRPSPNVELPWLVMELMHIDLTGFIEQREQGKKDIPFHFKLSILVDTCQGLQFLHSKNIAHRDLSSNNILLTKRHLVAKIADLGMAKVISADSQKHTKAPGTQDFMPPEALAGDQTAIYGIKIDVFSVGCVSLHVISMQWPEPKAMKLLDEKAGKLVALTEVQRRERYFKNLQQFPILKQLVFQCLNDDSKERPTVKEILEGLRTVQRNSVLEGDDGILQLYDSVDSSKRLLDQKETELAQKDRELAQKKTQLDCKELELTEKSKQLEIVEKENTQQLEQLRSQLAEAKKQLTLKDEQLADTKQQLQSLVTAEEDSQVRRFVNNCDPICENPEQFRKLES